MGAPKQKWTAEEEAALKAGVIKHGTGKWRTILSDPEFSAILHSRSNVDLKDKWRNINVTAIWGSRQKAKLALKKTSLTPKLDGRTPVTPKHDGRTQLTPKHDDNPMALSTVPQNDEVVDAKPLAISSGTLRASGSKESVARLDKLILEAISNLKELNGSDRTAIASYIEVLELVCKFRNLFRFANTNSELIKVQSACNALYRGDFLINLLLQKEQYWAPANLRKLLATKLKFLTANGTLIKVKHKYRHAPTAPVSVAKRSPKLLLEGRQKGSLKAHKKEINILMKSQVDDDLSRMRGMTAQEAAAAAAQAIAEAEVAIAEAEEAAREAERAEAEAEAAQVFAKAAIEALKCRALRTW